MKQDVCKSTINTFVRRSLFTFDEWHQTILHPDLTFQHVRGISSSRWK